VPSGAQDVSAKSGRQLRKLSSNFHVQVEGMVVLMNGGWLGPMTRADRAPWEWPDPHRPCV
jgi:hypothetical protein